ncbi:MATE family efflux transporter [Rubricoccus marinus]|uniref:MATE family efflux transporter n=2 Tax=Rubricoccus marinus TaxID=716817 RepID=A0A259U458_9BACT|nr:MATE family efflux transporter [Rubricoccus marinus]
MRLSPTDREIAALAVPALGALAADPLVSLVDTAFVGQTGVVPLAALGVCTAVFGFAFLAFNFLAYGTTPLVAGAHARGEGDEVSRLVWHALALALGAGLLAMAALEVFAVPVLRVMGASGALLDEALVYLRIRALAAPAVLVIMVGHGAFRGAQDTRTPLWVTLGLNLVNLVLDPLLIFGLGWGLAGAAWATVIAQASGAGVFVWLLLRGTRTAPPVRRQRLQWAVIRPLVQIGGDLALRVALLVGTLTFATAVAARLGTRAVAAHQVARELWLFLALVVDALAVAGQALVARYRGMDEMAKAREVSDRLLAFGLVTGAALGIAFWLGGPWLIGLFTDDPEVASGVAMLFPFVAAMQPLNALVFVWDGVFMGAERFRFLALAMCVSALVGCAVIALVLPLGLGLAGVWWGITAFMAARLATLAVGYRGLWRAAA